MKVEPKIASDIIRPYLAQHEPNQAIDPAELHRQVYLNQICQFLGMEPNPTNLNRIIVALEHFGIDLDNFQEWPKQVGDRVVNNEKEAAEADREYNERVAAEAAERDRIEHKEAAAA